MIRVGPLMHRRLLPGNIFKSTPSRSMSFYFFNLIFELENLHGFYYVASYLAFYYVKRVTASLFY